MKLAYAVPNLLIFYGLTMILIFVGLILINGNKPFLDKYLYKDYYWR